MQQTIIITGAGKGIGFALVNRFLKESNFIVVAISRDVLRLSEFRANNLHIIKGDLLHDYDDILAQINSYTESINYLINNAALVQNLTLEQTGNKVIEEVLYTNFKVPYTLIRDLSARFMEGSHIVNIGSMSGYQGSKKFKGLSLYSASKAALASLSECVAEEWLDRKVACNCLALGSVDTDMIKVSIPGIKPGVAAIDMADYIYNFTINGHKYYNGKVLPVSLTTL